MKDFFNKKNNKIMFSIICGTIILIVIVFLIFNFYLRKKNDYKKELVDNSQDVENVISNYDNWYDYLDDQQMDTAVVQNTENKIVNTIDKDQLDEIFIIISNNLIKVYGKDFEINNKDSLIIIYSRENINYKIEIIDGFVFGVQDKNLIALFDKNISEIKNEKYKDKKGYTFVYKIKNFENLNLNSYLK